ncbi:MAG: hypothetical protein KBS95_06990 [Alistipes sp.]|nr:hypothetical protein [Candidatus Alistipes equi]
MSSIAARGRVNTKMKHIDSVRLRMRQFMPVIAPERNLSDYCRDMLEENVNFRSYILDSLGHTDFNITNMRIKKTSSTLSIPFSNDNVVEYYKLGMED